MNNIYRRIKALCEEKDITIYELEKACNISNGRIAKWSTQSPNVFTLLKVADYLHCDLGYLLGTAYEQKDSEPTEEERILIKHYNRLTKENKTLVLSIVKALGDRHGNNGKSKKITRTHA